MRLSKVTAIVQDTPQLPPDRGREIYEFVRQQRPTSVLELGFAHGVSSCYIAAALKANGQGELTTIDLEDARNLEPNLDTMLGRADLKDVVRAIYTPTSYNWELMRIIERTPPGEWVFDFAFVDGAHEVIDHRLKIDSLSLLPRLRAM